MGDLSLLIPDETDRCREQIEFDPFLFCVMNFGRSGGQFLSRAPINDAHTVCAQTHGRPGRIHGHIATPKDNHVFALGDGGIIFRKKVGLHEIGPGEVFVGRVNSNKVFSGNVQKTREPRSYTDENSVIAIFE